MIATGHKCNIHFMSFVMLLIAKKKNENDFKLNGVRSISGAKWNLHFHRGVSVGLLVFLIFFPRVRAVHSCGVESFLWVQCIRWLIWTTKRSASNRWEKVWNNAWDWTRTPPVYIFREYIQWNVKRHLFPTLAHSFSVFAEFGQFVVKDVIHQKSPHSWQAIFPLRGKPESCADDDDDRSTQIPCIYPKRAKIKRKSSHRIYDTTKNKLLVFVWWWWLWCSV